MPFDWDDLIARIQLGTVVPIVGQELTRQNGKTLEWQLTQSVADELKLKVDGAKRLNDLVVRHPDAEMRVRVSVQRQLDALGAEPPPVLRKLAAIKDFNLFVSTTFDSQLERALNTERFGGRNEAIRRSYDLHQQPEDYERTNHPQVYHLFGHYRGRRYALTDVDALEILHRLQRDTSAPPSELFKHLAQSSLLVVGLGYPDWLCRSLFRTMVGRSLNEARSTREVLADECLKSNPEAVLFLKHCHAHLVEHDVVGFVDELHERWTEAQPTPAAAPQAPQADAEDQDVPDAGTIFISYCSDDFVAAERMWKRLEENHLATWFDRVRLRPGDAWRPMLQYGIARASLFIPLLSRKAMQYLDREYRKEWAQAFDRLPTFFGTTYRFIHPVIIDDLDKGALPPEFAEFQVPRFINGEPDADFIDRLRNLMREYQTRGKR